MTTHESSDPIRFSVLICTYNRAPMLDKCLRALIDRTCEKPDQVVVVNGGSDDADNVLASYMDRPGIEVKLVKTMNKNLAASRNIGLPHCTGSIIAMTDDDAEVFPDWVTQMKAVHAAHPDAGAVGGPVIGSDKDSLVSRIADEVTFRRYTSEQTVRTLPGVNVSYKREVVEAVGSQDEALFRGEDVDYNWRVKQHGYEIIYHPDIKVLHHHRPTLRRFINQHYMYGRAYYLVRHKWPEMYSVYPHRLRRTRDILKAANFFAGTLYEPLIYARKMRGLGSKLATMVVLLLNGIFWRAGMVRQKIMTRDK
jgi:GT2 family glycosyltransferase